MIHSAKLRNKHQLKDLPARFSWIEKRICFRVANNSTEVEVRSCLEPGDEPIAKINGLWKSKFIQCARESGVIINQSKRRKDVAVFYPSVFGCLVEQMHLIDLLANHG